MARVYSERFLDGSGASGTQSIVVPDGVKWVVRDIDGVVTTSVGDTRIIAGFDPGTGARAILYQDVTAPAQFSWRGRQVLNSGDTLEIYSDSDLTTFDFSISGYSLSLP